jgi:hypothetical protein
MIQPTEGIPNSVRYPIEEAIRFAGRDYFTSSVAFMLALAGMEGFTEVHLYGINLAIGDEYFYEKPCAEWWIGRLEGMGTKVYVPSASSLLKQHRRYGYSIDARPAQSLKLVLQNRAGHYGGQAEGVAAEFNKTMGRKQELDELLTLETLVKPLLQTRAQEHFAKADKLAADFNTLMGAKREAESLQQIAEGIDHGADIVLIPQPVAVPTGAVEQVVGSTVAAIVGPKRRAHRRTKPVAATTGTT